MDFYSLCAHYWVLSRPMAKFKVLTLFLDSGMAPDRIPAAGSCKTAQMQPYVLDNIPMEARFEMLAFWGICLGDT